MNQRQVIHVHQKNIRENEATGSDLPVFLVMTTEGFRQGQSVICHGPVEFVYKPNEPLHTGAHAYAVTYGNVEVN